MEYADIRYVRGNDVTLLVKVKTPVIGDGGQPVTDESGNITFEECELDTFDEWGLRVVRQGIKTNIHTVLFDAGTDRGTIVVKLPYTLPCGTYALEFVGQRNDQHVRSYELVMFGIVEDNKDANVIFGEIGGHRSLDLDITVQYVAQTTTRGKNAYELWRDLEGNENKTLQDYFDYLGRQEDYSNKADKVRNATNNNFATLDENGNIKDSGLNPQNFLNPNDLLEYPVNDNGVEYVDLGLPSGTLWATKNVGAATIYDYGNYYRFGTGTTKYHYSSPSDDSDFYQGSYFQIPLEYDTAHLVLGGDWVMPTREQINELIDNTDISWEENYQNSGVNGIVFANNGQKLFIPAGGWVQSGESTGKGSYCDIWSNERSNSTDSNLLVGQSGGTASVNSVHCLTGMNVRGVIVRDNHSEKAQKYLTSHQDISFKEDAMIITPCAAFENLEYFTLYAKPSRYYKFKEYLSSSGTIELVAPRQDVFLSKYMFRMVVGGSNVTINIDAPQGYQVISPSSWDNHLDIDCEYIITIIFDGTTYILSYEKYAVEWVANEGL